MKRNQIEINRATVLEGAHTLKITSIEEPTVEVGSPTPTFNVIKGTLSDMDNKPVTVYLNTTTQYNRPSLYDNAMLDIATQVNEQSDFDTDDVVNMSVLFSGTSVTVWVVHSTKDDKEYTNYYFNDKAKAVQAMLTFNEEMEA